MKSLAAPTPDLEARHPPARNFVGGYAGHVNGYVFRFGDESVRYYKDLPTVAPLINVIITIDGNVGLNSPPTTAPCRHATLELEGKGTQMVHGSRLTQECNPPLTNGRVTRRRLPSS